MFKYGKIDRSILRKLSSIQHQAFTEIKIPVPWGFIAGKWWGPQNTRPILALHGWQDNCGSFNTLIPYLSKNVSFLAIDFPGHGFSSYISKGGNYEWIDYVFSVRRVVKYFNWPKVTLMGHSLGATICYFYAVIYPGTVDFLIGIEGLKPPSYNFTKLKYAGKNIDKLIKFDEINSKSSEPPSYSIEELRKKMNSKLANSILPERCEELLQRNIRQSNKEPSKFHYQRDLRLKVLPLLALSEEVIMESTKQLMCPTLLCLGDHKNPYFSILLNSQDFYEAIKKTNKDFKILTVAGSHYVHLNSPELLEGAINNFIKKYDEGDRSMNINL